MMELADVKRFQKMLEGRMKLGLIILAIGLVIVGSTIMLIRRFSNKDEKE